MVTVVRVHLASNIPNVGCELKPHIELRRPDQSVTTDDVTELNPIDGHFLRYKWYRIQSGTKVAVCSVHQDKLAVLQCLGCVKAKIHVANSYHCSSKCYTDAWPHHRALHDRAAISVNSAGGSTSQSNSSLSTGTNASYSAPATQGNDGETCIEVGQSKTYIPTGDDLGHVLKFECVVVHSEQELAVGPATTLLTSPVILRQSLIRHLISVNRTDLHMHLGLGGQISFPGTFTVLSYNILSDARSTSELYSYCASWALSWTYRSLNLLREIVGYHADVVCLQEVQMDHFEEFFSPELGKRGYDALFKSKTSEVTGGNIETGCATFFLRDRFSHMKQYEVEFDNIKQSLDDASVKVQENQSTNASSALDNVALVAVLRSKDRYKGTVIPGKCQLCVANINLDIPEELADVKLPQVHALLVGLEKITASGDIPVLLCGTLNSVPGSAVYALIASGKVDPRHPDLAGQPFHLLQAVPNLKHQLRLVSAYALYPRGGTVSGLDHRRSSDRAKELLFTTCSRDFIGTHDYIFYSADCLIVESLLELLKEIDLGIPSPDWSSNHVALVAKFHFRPRSRRRPHF